MLVSNQAKAVLIIQIIQIVSAIAVILVSKAKASAKAFATVLSLVLMGIGAFATFMVINCMVYGDCGNLAWLIVGVMAIFIVLSVVGTLFGIVAVKQMNAQAPQQKQAPQH